MTRLRTALTVHSVKLPKSFVAIDLSEKAPDAFERTSNGTFQPPQSSKSDEEERGRTDERTEETTPGGTVLGADAAGNAVPPNLAKEVSPTELPPPAMDL